MCATLGLGLGWAEKLVKGCYDVSSPSSRQTDSIVGLVSLTTTTWFACQRFGMEQRSEKYFLQKAASQWKKAQERKNVAIWHIYDFFIVLKEKYGALRKKRAGSMNGSKYVAAMAAASCCCCWKKREEKSISKADRFSFANIKILIRIERCCRPCFFVWSFLFPKKNQRKESERACKWVCLGSNSVVVVVRIGLLLFSCSSPLLVYF